MYISPKIGRLEALAVASVRRSSPALSGTSAFRFGTALLAAVAVLLFPLLSSHALALQDDPAAFSSPATQLIKRSAPAAGSFDGVAAELSPTLSSGVVENINAVQSSVFISNVTFIGFLLTRTSPGRSPPVV